MRSCCVILKKNLWRNRELREHVSVLEGKIEPTIVLKNGMYLNVFLNQWLKAHIWIYKDRIIYVGPMLPKNLSSIEVVDCSNKYIVPGYIEPHAHPFQLYNPESLAYHAAKTGTTTLVNDSIMWSFLTDHKKAFAIVQQLDTLPISMYWWGRYDSQTALKDEQKYFNTRRVLSWVNHSSVVQGGELSSWPRLLDGDDRLLYWMQETKRLGKPIEGHLPGASRETLLKMKLLGISGDHESMSGEEVLQRLALGYHVSLRYSSIRPDLPKLVQEILEKNLTNFNQMTFTTDGSTPLFYRRGLINVCLEIAMNKGIPLEEAYKMASYNAAKHFQLDDDMGSIAPGKVAHINILRDKEDPHPESVLAKGHWVIKNGEIQLLSPKLDWQASGIKPLAIDWELQMDDLQFSSPIGLKLVNEVIVCAEANQFDHTLDKISDEMESAFLLFIDREGKWRANTTLNGFTRKLGGLVSSYSPTGDHLVIGKDKYDMLLAWQRMKEIGGGIVLVHQRKILFELSLSLGGLMFAGDMDTLIEKEKEMREILRDFGYPFQDPIFTLYFLSSTNLPYVRITQKGIYDVMKRSVLFPATMR